MRRHIEDSEIIEHIRKETSQTDEVLKYVYQLNFESVKRYIVNTGGTEEDAKDTFQDALVVFINAVKRRNFERRSSIKTYVFAITKNLWLKELRQTGKFSFTEIDLVDEQLPEENSIEITDKIALLNKAMMDLSEECRTLLLDFYYKKSSMRDLMAKFGLGSEQAAKNKKYRCMSKLMTLCEKSGLTNESLSQFE